MSEMALRFRIEVEMAAARAALDQGVASFRQFGAQAQAAMRGAGSGFDALRASVDPAYANMLRFKSIQAQVAAAVASGEASQDAANIVLREAAIRYNGVASAADIAAAAQKEAAAASAEVAAKAAAAERETATLASRFASLRASVDPAYSATVQFANAQDLAANAVRAGVASQAQAEASLTALAAKLGGAVDATGRFAIAQDAAIASSRQGAAITGNVAAQFNDIGVMLAAGQNPFQLAIQQGTQLGQALQQVGGGAKGALAALKSGFMAMISPTTLLTIGLIAGGAALVQWAMNAGSAADATKQAEDAVKTYGDALGDIQGQYSAATSLHAEYVLAVKTGNTDLINAIGLEANARQAMFNLEKIGQADAQAAAKKAMDDQTAAVAATVADRLAALDRVKAAQQAVENEKTTPLIGTEAAAQQLELEQIMLAQITDQLTAQQAALDKTSKEYAVIDAQVAVLNAKYKANGDLIQIVKDGVIGTSDALGDGAVNADAMLDSAVKLLDQLQQEAAIRAAITQHGADSAIVAQMRFDAEQKAFRASVAAMDVSISLKRELVAAWDAANGIADADMTGGIVSAASSAATLARNLGISLDAAQRMMQLGNFQGPVVLDPRDPRYDAAKARAANFQADRGGFEYGTTSPFDPAATPETPATGDGGGVSTNQVQTLAAQAAAATAALDVAVAAINEKVKAGLLSTADAAEAISAAKSKSANDIAELIAELDRLGPAGTAAAAALRASLGVMAAGLQGPIDDLSKELAGGLTDPLKEFMAGTIKAEDVFDKMGDSIIAKLIEVAAQQAKMNFIAPVLSKFFGSIAGTGVGDAVLSAFGAAPTASPVKLATGGLVAGPGSGTSDSVPAWLSNGEFVVNAAATARNKALLRVINGGGDALEAATAQPRLDADLGKASPTPNPFMRLVSSEAATAQPRLPSEALRAPALPPTINLPSFPSPQIAAPGFATGQASPQMPAPQINVKIEGVPAGYEARTEHGGTGMDQMLTVIIEQVDNAIGQRVRANRSSAGHAMRDTYGLDRRPR